MMSLTKMVRLLSVGAAGCLSLGLVGTAAAEANKPPVEPFKACANAKSVLSVEVPGKCTAGTVLVTVGAQGATRTTGRTATGAQGVQGPAGLDGIDRISGGDGTNGASVPILRLIGTANATTPSTKGGATTSPTATSTRHVAASGGTVTWTAWAPTGTHLGWCTWSSSPRVPKFNASVRCTGKVSRSAHFKANTSTGAEDYALTLRVLGKTTCATTGSCTSGTTVDYLKVVEAGVAAPSPPPASPPPPPAKPATSQNWSGYHWLGATDGVSGEWTVPTLDCADTSNGMSSDWVGVNGWEDSSGLFQTGVNDECDNGYQIDWAWFTDEAEGYSSDQGTANDVFDDVSAGDVISAEVYLDVNGYWDYVITDLTSGATAGAEVQDGNDYLSGAAGEAEWIDEDTGCADSSLCWWNGPAEVFPFPNFGSVTFTDLTLAPVSGSWTLPYSDALEMIYPDGSPEVLPSQPTASSFTVTYESDSGS